MDNKCSSVVSYNWERGDKTSREKRKNCKNGLIYFGYLWTIFVSKVTIFGSQGLSFFCICIFQDRKKDEILTSEVAGLINSCDGAT